MKVKVTINKQTGEVKIEVFDATGQECLITSELEKNLGKIENKTFKPEFYQPSKKNIQGITI